MSISEWTVPDPKDFFMRWLKRTDKMDGLHPIIKVTFCRDASLCKRPQRRSTRYRINLEWSANDNEDDDWREILKAPMTKPRDRMPMMYDRCAKISLGCLPPPTQHNTLCQGGMIQILSLALASLFLFPFNRSPSFPDTRFRSYWGLLVVDLFWWYLCASCVSIE